MSALDMVGAPRTRQGDDPSTRNAGAARARRIGVIGCGLVVQQSHLPTLMSLPDVEIVWVSDIDPARAQQLSKASGAPFASHVGSSELTLADVVLVAIPWGARQPLYAQLRAMPEPRPNLFVEKPFAKTMAEHKANLDGYRDWQVAVGHLRKSLGTVQLVRHLTEAGVFGAPRSLAIRYGWPGRILAGGRYASDITAAGGGSLFEMGVHYIDAALHCVGAKDAMITDATVVTHDGFDIHTDATFTVIGADGGSLSGELKVTNLQAVGQGIEITFENASVAFDIGAGNEIVIRTKHGLDLPLQPPASLGPLEPFALLAQHWRMFFKALDERSPNFVNACATLLTTKLIEQVYERQG